MNRSKPSLPVHHQPLEFTQTHAHWVSDPIQPSSSVVPFSSCSQSLPASGSFPMSQLFPWGGQSIGVSANTRYLFFSFWHASLCVTGSRLKQLNIKLIGIDWAGRRKLSEAGGVVSTGIRAVFTEHLLSAWHRTFTWLFTRHISSEFSNNSKRAHYPNAVISTLYKGKENLTAFKSPVQGHQVSRSPQVIWTCIYYNSWGPWTFRNTTEPLGAASGELRPESQRGGLFNLAMTKCWWGGEQGGGRNIT